MRPKFKAWDKVNNKWFKPTYNADKYDLQDLSISLEGDLMMRGMSGSSHESAFPNRFEVVQYVDITDGTHWDELTEQEREIWTRAGNMPRDWKGKEMCEEDVLDSVEGYQNYHPNRVIIERHAMAFMYVGITLNASPLCDYTLDTITNKNIKRDRSVKIIGNLRENPELREGTKGS